MLMKKRPVNRFTGRFFDVWAPSNQPVAQHLLPNATHPCCTKPKCLLHDKHEAINSS
jgi:hypothetical protein